MTFKIYIIYLFIDNICHDNLFFVYMIYLPIYRLFVGTEMFEFLSIDTGPIDPSIFMLPKHVNCTWEED
jgi:hypothetical protein